MIISIHAINVWVKSQAAPGKSWQEENLGEVFAMVYTDPNDLQRLEQYDLYGYYDADCTPEIQDEAAVRLALIAEERIGKYAGSNWHITDYEGLEVKTLSDEDLAEGME